MNRQFIKENLPTLILMGITAIGITVTGIIFRQSFLRILPLYISLIVALLQSQANRYAPLIGGINSVLYCFVYIHYRLYGSAAQALLISFPFQIATFIRWSRNKWGQTTLFRKMNGKQRILTVAGFIAAVLGMWLGLRLTNANYVLLDSLVTLLGLLTSILTMFAFVEYAPLMLVSASISIVLYLSMLGEFPDQTTYLVYSLYCFVCQCMAFVRIRKLYRSQQASQA